MPRAFEPKLAHLPPAQRQIWSQLAPAAGLSFVLYGGTAVALQIGHRVSIDFDFFSARPLDKSALATRFAFLPAARTIQEEENTLVTVAAMPEGPVQVSFFGGIAIGHINEPLRTSDDVLLVASLEDLLATKLKTILDRAEAKDYLDIAAMISAGTSFERGLGGFAKMYRKDPALALKAVGYFKDGDLPSLPKRDQDILRTARDRVSEIPEIEIRDGSLAG